MFKVVESEEALPNSHANYQAIGRDCGWGNGYHTFMSAMIHTMD